MPTTTPIPPIALIAHEICNVATALTTGASLIEDHIRSARSLLIIVLDNASRLCRIIRRLQDGDAFFITPQHVHLHETLRIAVAPFHMHPTVRAHNIRIFCDLSPETDQIVALDPDFFPVAVWNLIQNAIQADARTITITTRTEHNHILILITDDGHGLSDTTPTGFGLPFVSRIIHEHGGSFALLPNPKGRGALARISIPPLTGENHP